MPDFAHQRQRRTWTCRGCSASASRCWRSASPSGSCCCSSPSRAGAPRRRTSMRLIEMAGLVLILVCILGRTWCTLYIGGLKKRELVTAGPYSVVRNPLYVFTLDRRGRHRRADRQRSSSPLLFAAGTLAVFQVVARHEEAFLAATFPATLPPTRRACRASGLASRSGGRPTSCASGRAWCAARSSMPACSCWRCPPPAWWRGCSSSAILPVLLTSAVTDAWWRRRAGLYHRALGVACEEPDMIAARLSIAALVGAGRAAVPGGGLRRSWPIAASRSRRRRA